MLSGFSIDSVITCKRRYWMNTTCDQSDEVAHLYLQKASKRVDDLWNKIDQIKDRRAVKRANFKVAAESLATMQHKASIEHDRVRQLEQQNSPVRTDQGGQSDFSALGVVDAWLESSGDEKRSHALLKARARAEMAEEWLAERTSAHDMAQRECVDEDLIVRKLVAEMLGFELIAQDARVELKIWDDECPPEVRAQYLAELLGFQTALEEQTPTELPVLYSLPIDPHMLPRGEQIKENANIWRERIEQIVASDRKPTEDLEDDLPW
jgi:hypothetical protein